MSEKESIPHPSLQREKKLPVNSVEVNKEYASGKIVNDLKTTLSTTLGARFDGKNMAFNIRDFQARVARSIEQVFLNNNIPESVKMKFKADLMGKIDILSGVTLEKIESLKNQRMMASFGLENDIIGNKTDAEKQAYYLDMILEKTIGRYVEPVVYSLTTAFAPREKVGAGEYNKALTQEFFHKIVSLDATTGARVSGEVAKLLPGYDIASQTDASIRKKMLTTLVSSFGTEKKEVKMLLDKLGNNTFNNAVEDYKKNGPAKNVDPGSLASLFHSPEQEVLLGKIIPYIDTYDDFSLREQEIRTVRRVALSTDTLSKVKAFTGAEQLKSEFEHLKPTDIEAKMKDKSLADFVIMATSLAPITGDLERFASAYSGMNVDGAKLGALERSLNVLYGALGITVVGGFVLRARSAGKIKELAEGLMVMIKYLPTKIAEYTKKGGVIPEAARNLLMKAFPTLKPAYFGPETNALTGVKQVIGKTRSGVGSIVSGGNKTDDSGEILSCSIKGMVIDEQDPGTANCGHLNLKAILDFLASQNPLKNLEQLTHSTFSLKTGLSPKAFVQGFKKIAGESHAITVEHPGKGEILSIIERQLQSGMPVPMIYVPIGGKVLTPHYATIVGMEYENGEKIYRILDSMSKVIPRDYLTGPELLDALAFNTLKTPNPGIHNTFLQGVASLAKKYLGGEHTIFVVQGR